MNKKNGVSVSYGTYSLEYAECDGDSMSQISKKVGDKE
jgi:hypothetical protein